jgi:hypothetical protein
LAQLREEVALKEAERKMRVVFLQEHMIGIEVHCNSKKDLGWGVPSACEMA